MIVSIKRALITDAPLISFLGKQTFTQTFGDLFNPNELNDYLDITFNIRKLENSLSGNHNIFGLLYYGDKPVGYYKVKMGRDYDNMLSEKQCQLQKIYILDDYLHLGLGKEMLNHILELKEMEGFEIIWLVVLHSNYRAIKFYEKHGFKKFRKYDYTIGSHKLEYELMTKEFPL